MTALARFAWGVLAYNVAVIVWGAYVRATGSGAGCGSHWPLCNGEVVPRSPTTEMLVEFSHRATSGVALLAVVGLVAWTWRRSRPGHPARQGAAWSLLLILGEAAVGAALVLFGLVADNASLARAMFMAVHLVNTFALLAALTLTAFWLSGGLSLDLEWRRAAVSWLGLGVVGVLLVGVSGAVAALGDTLWPAGSLAEALGADLSPASHLLIRLRLLHPALAIGVGVGLILLAIAMRDHGRPVTRRLGTAVLILTLIQLAAGFGNVLLLAPVWMQLVHLLLADGLWIAYVLMGATVLERAEISAQVRQRVA